MDWNSPFEDARNGPAPTRSRAQNPATEFDRHAGHPSFNTRNSEEAPSSGAEDTFRSTSELLTEIGMQDSMLARLSVDYGRNLSSKVRSSVGRFVSIAAMKHYFDVNHSYVRNKLRVVLYPFSHRNWERTRDRRAPRDDINSPDLYIPLMAFCAFIVVSGMLIGRTNSMCHAQKQEFQLAMSTSGGSDNLMQVFAAGQLHKAKYKSDDTALSKEHLVELLGEQFPNRERDMEFVAAAVLTDDIKSIEEAERQNSMEKNALQLLLAKCENFTPEKLWDHAMSGLVFLVIEALVMKLAIHLVRMPVSLDFLELIALGGYKYVGVALSTVALVFLGTLAYYATFVVSSAAMCVFMNRTLCRQLLAQTSTGGSGRPPLQNTHRQYFVLLAAIAQFPLSFALGPPL